MASGLNFVTFNHCWLIYFFFSQELVLSGVRATSSLSMNIDGNTYVMVDIKFGLDRTEDEEVPLSSIIATFQSLSDAYRDGEYTFERVPEKFEKLVREFRTVPSGTLYALAANVFACSPTTVACNDPLKVDNLDFFYLNGLSNHYGAKPGIWFHLELL